VRDLLDFTRARMGGGIPVVRRPLDLHALVRSTLQEVEAAQPERGLSLTVQGNAQGSWDERRLGQVVQNLVGNAQKYGSEDAPVQVTVRGEDEHVLLEVHNGGAPIPAELLPRIFEPLQRGAVGADPHDHSVGLGLFIVKHLVEAHGGQVSVCSTEQAGTTFTVRLPRR